MSLKTSFLACLIISLTACQPYDSQLENKEDDFPEFSQEELQQMIQNSPQAQMQMAQHQNSSDDLINKIEELLQQEPNNIEHNYNLAKLYYQKFMQDKSEQNCTKAIQGYSKAIQLQPDYELGKPYYNRMLCYTQIGNWEAALEDINQFEAINKGQTKVNYWAMRADILYHLDKKEAACVEYQKAHKVWETDSLPYENKETWIERCK